MKLTFLFVALLCMISCSNEYHKVRYYKTGEVADEMFGTSIDSIRQFFLYYKSGKICREGYFLYNGSSDSGYKATGICKDYYPDGFPKNEYRCVHGQSLIPCIDSMDNYKVVVDFAPQDSVIWKVVDGDSTIYWPFRVFVKGVVDVSYVVYAVGVDNEPNTPYKTQKRQVEYKMIRDDGNEFHQTIDETMYPYMIPYDEYFFKKEETEKEINYTACIAIVFPAIPESLAERPHKTAHFTLCVAKP